MKRTTRRGMWRTGISRIAAVLAGLTLVVAPLAAVPAYADPVNIQVTVSPSQATAKIGEADTTITVTLSNTDRRKTSDAVEAAVSLTGIEEHAAFTVNQGGCDSVQGASVSCGELPPRGQKNFTVTISPRTDSDLAEGQTAAGSLAVSVSGGNTGSGTGRVTIEGTNQNAPGITGTVVNFDKEPIEGVKVVAKDSKSKTFDATTDAAGVYTINQPIAAGAVDVTFTKDGLVEKTEQAVAQTGQMLTLDIRMQTEEAEEEPSEEPEPTVAETVEEDDSSGLSPMMWILIVLGGLLVVGGIVAIVMLIRKGRSDDDDDDDSVLPDVPSIHKPHATQTGQLGVYDSSPRPGMDAPTMIHNGPLVNDNDLARYGSEPSSGFGPSYDTPKRGEADDSTKMYPSSGGPTSGAGYGNPTSGASAGYGSSGPTSGAGYGNPASGAGYSNPTSGAGTGYSNPASGAGYGSSGPTSGAGYGSDQNTGYSASRSSTDSTRMYPTSGGPTSGQGWDQGGRSQQGGAQQPGWSDRQQDAGGWGRGYQDPGSQGGAGGSAGYSDPYRGQDTARGWTGGDAGRGPEGGAWSSSSQQNRWGSGSDRASGQQGDRGAGWDGSSGWDTRGYGGQDRSARPDADGGQQNWGREHRGDWNRGGDDRQPPPRRYGDDGYDDRPKSW